MKLMVLVLALLGTLANGAITFNPLNLVSVDLQDDGIAVIAVNWLPGVNYSSITANCDDEIVFSWGWSENKQNLVTITDGDCTQVEALLGKSAEAGKVTVTLNETLPSIHDQAEVIFASIVDGACEKGQTLEVSVDCTPGASLVGRGSAWAPEASFDPAEKAPAPAPKKGRKKGHKKGGKKGGTKGPAIGPAKAPAKGPAQPPKAAAESFKTPRRVLISQVAAAENAATAGRKVQL